MGFKISKAAGLPKTTRSTVKPHALFQSVKNGRPHSALYANFGYSKNQGRWFSVALQGSITGKDGVLFSTEQGTKEVVVKGTWAFEIDAYGKGKEIVTTRNRLQAGDVFQVPASKENRLNKNHKPPMYVALGMIEDDKKVLSYNLNTKELAVGTKLTGKVAKVGTAAISKTAVAA